MWEKGFFKMKNQLLILEAQSHTNLHLEAANCISGACPIGLVIY
jgi:hypothetical protein